MTGSHIVGLLDRVDRAVLHALATTDALVLGELRTLSQSLTLTVPICVGAVPVVVISRADVYDDQATILVFLVYALILYL